VSSPKIIKPADSNFSSARIEAFSDGVIAIIITLMILEIKIPDLHKNPIGYNMWLALKPMVPNILAYLLSFVMLGIYWVNHHNFFHKIESADRRLLWLNLNLLFWFSLIPIPTAIMGEEPLRPESCLLYGAIQFLCSASFTYMGIYANKKELFTGKVPVEIRKKNMQRNRLSLFLYLLAMGLSYVSVFISYTIFAYIAAMFFMPKLGIIQDSKPAPVAPTAPEKKQAGK
jgi:uncharacterized membrane protein